jgi:release factor glutamine methyltransferase
MVAEVDGDVEPSGGPVSEVPVNGFGEVPVSGSVRSLRDAVRDAVRILTEAGVGSAEFDAVALAAHAARSSTSDVRRVMVMGGPVPEGFEDLVSERARRVPLQHLTGKAGFRRLELSVGPGVFIPRFETELTAALAIAHLQRSASQRVDGGERVVDLCSGSGAIGLAVKDEVPAAEVHGVELSEFAHAWAIHNRDDLGLEVDLRLGDATAAFPELAGRVDVVVSNPPYIPVGSIPNDPEVRDHDPEVALYGGSADGLRIPLEVAARAALLLRAGGFFVMEHADVQGDSLTAALRTTGLWEDVQDHPDLNGRPRAVTALRAL